MKFKSQLVTAASGSLGGVTFAHNRGGMYVRGRATPTNPNSTAQQAARANLSSLVNYWNINLTTAQRLAWSVYAQNVSVLNALGDAIFLTGQQMFVRCNGVRLRAGMALVDDGPVTFSMTTLTPPVLTATNPSTLSVAYPNTDPWAVIDDGALILSQAPPTGPTINFHKGPFRYLAKVDGDTATPPTSPATPTSLYTFGGGNRIWLRAIAVLPDGRISPPVIIQDDAA